MWSTTSPRRPASGCLSSQPLSERRLPRSGRVAGPGNAAPTTPWPARAVGGRCTPVGAPASARSDCLQGEEEGDAWGVVGEAPPTLGRLFHAGPARPLQDL